MVLFCDEQKQRKLEDAIRNGLILRTIDKDGVVRYRLTQAGTQQWAYERARKQGWVF